jgi:hypothetical protein
MNDPPGVSHFFAVVVMAAAAMAIDGDGAFTLFSFIVICYFGAASKH